jgi:ribosomal protein S1
MRTAVRIAGVAALALALGLTNTAWSQTAQGAAKSDPAKPTPASPAAEVKKAPEKLTMVTGKVKSVGRNGLVVQVAGKTPKELTFDLTGTMVKAGGKEASTSDLKDGDEVRIGYMEADGKLIAKTVSAKPAKVKK